MDAPPEKPGSVRRASVRTALDALAIASVVAAFAGAALACAGASWKALAYLSIVGVLFDSLFAYEFFYDTLRGRREGSLLRGLSSVAPLLLVSGPFIAGWALADLGAAAVRGPWLGRAPYGGLAVVAALRLLRVARPFEAAARRVAPPSRPDSSRPAAARSDARRRVPALAATIGLGLVLAGAVASDALLAPGLSAAGAAWRREALAAMEAASDDESALAAARASGAVALRRDDRVLLAAPADVSPSDYAALSGTRIEAWFSVLAERKARGAYEAVAALASLAAAAAYGWSVSARPATGRGSGFDSRERDGDGTRRRPPAGPAGSDELEAILGKRRL